MIGNVSKSTGILMLNGENDSQTLITYPNLAHVFYPSSQWQTSDGPIPQYVLADLYAWLETHSGITNHGAAAHIPTTSSAKP